MNCPVCNEQLLILDKQGIEIDYCPKCRGIWLDRGELEKIIERSNSFQSENRPQQKYNDDDDYHYKYKDKDYKYKKKKGFLGDIFDF